MKLILDMNLSPTLEHSLNEVGIEARHWSSLGDPKASDMEIMAFAKAADWVVVTHDLDFSAILAATNGAKPSVVQVRSTDLSTDRLRDALVKAVRQSANALERGALLSIDVDRQRVRLLPLLPE